MKLVTILFFLTVFFYSKRQNYNKKKFDEFIFLEANFSKAYIKSWDKKN